MFKRLISSIVCLTFSFTNIQYVHAQAGPATSGEFSINQLPVPGTMIGESAPFAPLALKGLIVNPQKPLEFQFIVDTGSDVSLRGAQTTKQSSIILKQQATQLVKYFLAGLTIPEGDLWVNLSPYEKNRMVPEALGQTDLGRDLLAQDYILKQLTASLIYPEKDLGKEFWSRVYAKAQAQFGTTNIPVNTFNKVWILPDQAQVFENGSAAYVTKSTLKVMLDEDYLAMSKHAYVGVAEGGVSPASAGFYEHAGETRGQDPNINRLGSQVVRTIILPEIEKEVNTGKNFAPLRQIYQALILAKWYKETIQNGLLDAVYTNKKKVAGVNVDDPAVKEEIYQRYLKAYKKGAFNYIKESPTPGGQAVPRKYFSGGEVMVIHLDRSGRQADVRGDGAMISLTVAMVAAGAGDFLKASGRKYSQKNASAGPDRAMGALIPHKIVELIGELNDRGIKPKIHGTDLLGFGDRSNALMDFIHRYSVLKSPDDIRRVLLWKLNSLTGIPMSGIDPKTAGLLYDAIFDQHAFLSGYATKDTPLNIVLFRRGRSGSELTNILNTIPDVNIKIILSATDDGLSWFDASREFADTGVPGAGKALLDLAKNRQLKDFLAQRLGGDNLTEEELARDFHSLIDKLKDPYSSMLLSDEMKIIYQKAMRLDVQLRKILTDYMDAFAQAVEKYRKSNQESKFSYKTIPLRSIVLQGAAFHFKGLSGEDSNYWQQAIDKLAEFLNINKGNRIIFPTKERQHILAVRADGTIYLSETGINQYPTEAPIIGLWLVKTTDDIQRIREELVKFTPVHVDLKRLTLNSDVEREIELTTLKVDQKYADEVAGIISKHSTTDNPVGKIPVTKETKDALSSADVILYADALLETNVGGALIIDGVKDAIAQANHHLKLGSKTDRVEAVKINLTELTAQENRPDYLPLSYLERLYRYITGQMAYRVHTHSWQGLNKYVDYVLGGVLGEQSRAIVNQFTGIESSTNAQVGAVTVEAATKEQFGFFSSEALKESMIAMTGIKAAGFKLADGGKLMPEKLAGNKSEWPKGQLGLFKQDNKVQSLIKEIIRNWDKIVKSGAFVFDVDMTILPKNAELLTEYRELAYLFMRLLREGVRVAIISGNSEEEQMARIHEAIKIQMQDDLRAMSKLTFYVNGGATKIDIDEQGNKQYDVEYNEAHGMDLELLEKAVNRAIEEFSSRKFGLNEKQTESFIAEARKKYPDLTLNALFMSGQSSSLEWVTPKEIIDRQQQRNEMNFPWVEKRGELTERGTGLRKVASIAIKPIPKLENIDARNELIELIENNLGDKRSQFNVRPGGSTTIDITRMGADKPIAMEHFVKDKKLDPMWVFYLGDEFFERKKRTGNDEQIARDPNLKGIRTLAVNKDDMEGADPKTDWIGRSPQATLEFLENILDAAMSHTPEQKPTKDAAMKADIKERLENGNRETRLGAIEELRGMIEGGDEEALNWLVVHFIGEKDLQVNKLILQIISNAEAGKDEIEFVPGLHDYIQRHGFTVEEFIFLKEGLPGSIQNDLGGIHLGIRSVIQRIELIMNDPDLSHYIGRIISAGIRTKRAAREVAPKLFKFFVGDPEKIRVLQQFLNRGAESMEENQMVRRTNPTDVVQNIIQKEKGEDSLAPTLMTTLEYFAENSPAFRTLSVMQTIRFLEGKHSLNDGEIERILEITQEATASIMANKSKAFLNENNPMVEIPINQIINGRPIRLWRYNNPGELTFFKSPDGEIFSELALDTKLQFADPIEEVLGEGQALLKTPKAAPRIKVSINKEHSNLRVELMNSDKSDPVLIEYQKTDAAMKATKGENPPMISEALDRLSSIVQSEAGANPDISRQVQDMITELEDTYLFLSSKELEQRIAALETGLGMLFGQSIHERGSLSPEHALSTLLVTALKTTARVNYILIPQNKPPRAIPWKDISEDRTTIPNHLVFVYQRPNGPRVGFAVPLLAAAPPQDFVIPLIKTTDRPLAERLLIIQTISTELLKFATFDPGALKQLYLPQGATTEEIRAAYEMMFGFTWSIADHYGLVSAPKADRDKSAEDLTVRIQNDILWPTTVRIDQLRVLGEWYSKHPVPATVVAFLAAANEPATRGEVIPDAISNAAVDALFQIYSSLSGVERIRMTTYLTGLAGEVIKPPALSWLQRPMGYFLFLSQRLQSYDKEAGTNAIIIDAAMTAEEGQMAKAFISLAGEIKDKHSGRLIESLFGRPSMRLGALNLLLLNLPIKQRYLSGSSPRVNRYYYQLQAVNDIGRIVLGEQIWRPSNAYSQRQTILGVPFSWLELDAEGLSSKLIEWLSKIHQNQEIDTPIIGLKRRIIDTIKKADAAMFTLQAKNDKAALAENGGIDLNQINVKRNAKKVNVQFDPAQLNQLEEGGFEGFTPVIINITPISSPFQLLGINPAQQPDTLAKV